MPKNRSKKKCARLQFLRSGSREGFVSQAVSSDNIANPSEIVRELIQNCIDAGNEAGRKKTYVNFEFSEVEVDKIPGIDEYKAALNLAKLAHKENLETAEAILDRIDTQLRKKKISVLNVFDSGIGLDSIRMNSLLSDGMTSKTGNSSDSGGSYGVGHFTAFPASDLQYILYGGVTKLKNRTMSGHAILASHCDSENFDSVRALGKDGYFIERQIEGKIDDSFVFAIDDAIPAAVAGLIDQIEECYEFGSVISILGFNNFKLETDPAEEIRKAVARSFFIPTSNRQLIVKCRNEVITPDILEDILRSQSSQKRKNTRTDVINGNWAFGHYRTYKSAEPRLIKTDFGTFTLYFRNCDPDESTRIALFRRGMFISDSVPHIRPSDFSKYKPFNAVILVEAMSDGTENPAFQLIRKAEGTKHLEFDVSRLKSDSTNKFENLFKQMKKEIENLCTKDTEELFSPSIFEIDLSTLQTINRFIPIVESTIPQGKKKRKTKGKTNRKNQRSNSSIVSTSCAIVASAKRDSENLQLLVQSDSKINDARLSIHLHSGSDVTCGYPLSDRNIRFEINSINSNILNGHNTAYLGEIEAGKPVSLSLRLIDQLPDDATLKVSIDDVGKPEASP